MTNTLAYADSAEFFDALRPGKLLPRGLAWSDDDPVLTGFRQALADIEAAFHARLADLSEVESDPQQAVELLPDWERAYGLPDPCAPQPQTIAQRRQALLARITDSGGLNPSRYIALAAALGFTITVTEFRPFRAGASHAGDPCRGLNWLFAWQVNAPLNTISSFAAGSGAAGEPLRSWGNAPLECVIRAHNRASRLVIFAYS